MQKVKESNLKKIRRRLAGVRGSTNCRELTASALHSSFFSPDYRPDLAPNVLIYSSDLLSAVHFSAVKGCTFPGRNIYQTMHLRPLERKAVAQVKAYIDEHYGEHITVDLLAEMSWQNDQVSFRARRLHDAFAAIFLQTIHDYHIQVRMEKAKTFLETTDLSVKAIGISVGYKADSSFSAAFKNYFGMSPSGFRNSWADG